MRWLFRFLIYLVCIIGVISLALWITGYGYIFRGLRLTYLKGYTSANIYDGNDFDTRMVKKGATASILPQASDYNRRKLPDSLQKMLDETGSASFMILQNDSILYEKYYQKHNDKLQSNSFSMAKTIITLLTEMAIEEKIIPGWDAKVKTYLPWLEGEFAEELTLRHLSAMTAGINWNESYYNPFSITAEAYYGRDIEKTMHKVKVISKPGERFIYHSGCTQLLGLCLRKATGKSITTFASEKLWVPIGAEADARWHLDHADGTELTYCCFNAVTRDFARIGQMMLHRGEWNKHHFVNGTFIDTMAMPKFDTAYGQSLWLGQSGKDHWMMFQGTLGQYIIVIPSKNLVVVRTGDRKKRGSRRIPDCGHMYADAAIQWILAR